MIEPRHLAIGAISGAIVWSLARIAARPTVPGPNGWRRITPGPMYWAGAGLGGVLFLLMGYVWLFVGSARVDAEHQMNVLFWLIVAFGIGTAILAGGIADIRWQSIHWHGGQLAFRARDGGRAVRSFDDLESIRRDFLGRYILQFSDGQTARLDEYAAGSGELLKSMEERTAGNLAQGGADE
jgi:hypothetical protein